MTKNMTPNLPLLEWHADTGWQLLNTEELSTPQTRIATWVKRTLSEDLDRSHGGGVSYSHSAFEAICAVCAKGFQAQRHSAKYCSRACENRDRRARRRQA